MDTDLPDELLDPQMLGGVSEHLLDASRGQLRPVRPAAGLLERRPALLADRAHVRRLLPGAADGRLRSPWSDETTEFGIRSGAWLTRGGTYDVIVVGLGAMGSATAYQLAKRGARVLGLEAFTPAHELGSSGGLTRIIRLAYFEHPSYVPLLKAAWALWPEIEPEADDHLLEVTGGLYIGRAGSDVLDGAMLSARTHGLEHELLDAAESRARFPAMQIADDMQTLHEPLAGLLFASRCIAAHLRLAARHGADLHFEERVTGWTLDGGEGGGSSAGGVTVTTTRGTYRAAKLVVSAGAWLPKLMPELAPKFGIALQVERNVAFWFEPKAQPEIFQRDRLPVWIIELDPEYAFYGFPMLPEQPAAQGVAATPAQGAKAARHHGGKSVDPDVIDRTATRRGRGAGARLPAHVHAACRRPAPRLARVHVYEHARPELRAWPRPT